MSRRRFYEKPPVQLPDLAAVREVVSPRIWKALQAASARLDDLGIPHALIGGLAVGAYGYPRATKDVDFLVLESAFEKHFEGIVTLTPGMPIAIEDVGIDYLSPAPSGLPEDVVLRSPESENVPIAPDWAVVWLKLDSPRSKDAADIVELLKAGTINSIEVRKMLPVRLEQKFDLLVARAIDEEADDL